MILEIDGFTTRWDNEEFFCDDDDDEHENGFTAAKNKHNDAATRLYLMKHKARVEDSLLKLAAGDFTRVYHTANDVRLQMDLENVETETVDYEL